MLVGIVMLAAIAANFVEYRSLWSRGGRMRELPVSVTLLTTGIALSLLKILHVKLPSVFKLIEITARPIQQIVDPLFT